jgi:hypothetical protein
MEQRDLAKLWRRAREQKLKDNIRTKKVPATFGAGNTAKATKWKNELKAGSLKGLKEELSELKDLAEKLKGAKNAAEKARLKRELESRIQDLADFAAGELNSKPLDKALQKALDQLALSDISELASDCEKGACEALDLAKLELGDLAGALEDLKKLESALKAASQAKALNEKGELDGSLCKGCEGIEDYEELFARLMAERGMAGMRPGQGPGMRGPGIGEGGDAPEDPTAKTAFKTELSKSALQAGKVLMKWKVQEVSDPGEAREAYAESVKKIKAGLNEAMLREEVPPGDHETVKRYFDALGEADDNSPPK